MNNISILIKNLRCFNGIQIFALFLDCKKGIFVKDKKKCARIGQ